MSVSRRTDRDRLRAGCACALPPPHPRRLTSLITTTSLKTQSWKDLAEMAKSKGLSGWHSMRKDDLVKALVRAAQRRAKLRAVHKSSRPSKTFRRATTMKSHSIHVKGHSTHSNGAKTNGAKTNGVKVNGTTKQPASAKGPRPTARQL